MKFILPVIIFSISLVTLSFANKKNIAKEETGFALVELFTSEGCSSCPSADALAKRLQKKYSDDNVLFLEYHVDYWDRLGWKDPFSSSLFTSRQIYYSRLFDLNSTYTPQAVVNGETEFVGSNAGKLEKAIANDLKNISASSINLKANLQPNNKIKTIYSSGNENSSQQLILLVVQKNATTKIERGENRGRILDHINIVRSINYLPVTTIENSITLKLPDQLTKDDVFLTAFIQDKKTGKVLNYTKMNIE